MSLSRAASLPLVVVLLTLSVVLVGCATTQNTPPATEVSRSTAVTSPASSPITTFPTQPASPSPVAPDQTVITPLPATASPDAVVPSATPQNPPQTVDRLPNPSGYTWQPVIQGLDSPVALIDPGDDSGRLFIVQQSGVIRIWQDDQVLPEPFLDISSQVTFGGERGLLGLDFHPDFPLNNAFFINYTDEAGNTVIARYEVSLDNPDLANPDSAQVLFHIDQPYQNHNGGEVLFGPDGYLYLGLGDGGSAGDPHNNAQSLNTLLGKILRVDVDSGDPYAIPPDNPFASGQGMPEIWAYGLRNPWRFSFDSATGDLYIGDVGQNQWEEIDYVPAGSPAGMNFGWNYFEGTHPYSRNRPPADLAFVMPIAEYSHQEGCSVTGGVVYRGQDLPEWQGVYLYADYCSGSVWGLLRQESSDGQIQWLNDKLFENTGRITSFGTDARGEVYMLAYDGTIYRLAAK